MNILLSLFAENLLPILIVAGAGYLLQRTLQVDPKPLARVTFYVFTPALAFSIAHEHVVAQTILFRVIDGWLL